MTGSRPHADPFPAGSFDPGNAHPEAADAGSKIRRRWIGAAVGFGATALFSLYVAIALPPTPQKWVDGYRLDPDFFEVRPAAHLGWTAVGCVPLVLIGLVQLLRPRLRASGWGFLAGAAVGMLFSGGVTWVLGALEGRGG